MIKSIIRINDSADYLNWMKKNNNFISISASRYWRLSYWWRLKPRILDLFNLKLCTVRREVVQCTAYWSPFFVNHINIINSLQMNIYLLENPQNISLHTNKNNQIIWTCTLTGFSIAIWFASIVMWIN